MDTEVIIVGGGPAGSACAWKLKQLPNNFWAYDWYPPTAVPAQPVK